MNSVENRRSMSAPVLEDAPSPGSVLAGEGGSLPLGGPAGSRRRVLIVEDEAPIARDLARSVARLGFDVVGVVDHLDGALDLCRVQQPDLVLVDRFLHGTEDGVEVGRALTQVCDVPVVVLMADADPETAGRAVSVGPYGCLFTPFDDQTLSASIAVALERHAAELCARHMRAAVDATSVGVTLVERGAPPRFVYVNGAFVAMSGRDRADCLRRSPCFLAADQDDEAVLRLRHALELGTAAEETVRIRRGDDESLRWLSVRMSPVLERVGAVTHMLMFYQDVTRSRDSELVSEVSQRMALMGQMTAEIVREFGDTLCAMTVQTQLAMEGMDPGPRRRDLEGVLDAAQRGAAIARKLVDFSRRPDAAGRGVSVAAALVALRPMARRLLRTHHTLTYQVDAAPMIARMDAHSFEQVMLNLLTNARDAMPDGGAVVVTATASGPDLAPGFVRVVVRDEGVGMDAATQRRAFEALFSTKAEGSAAGVGLPISRMLVERHGGRITLQSEVGVGTVVTVDLPVSALAESEVEAEDEAVPEGDAGGAYCLLVEDDPAVRQACQRALGQVGFRVMALAHRGALMRALERVAHEVGLVVGDLSGEGEGLPGALGRLRRVAPTVPVLATMGLGAAQGELADPDLALLWKPFSMNSLVRRALDLLRTASGASPFVTLRPPVAPVEPAPARRWPVARLPAAPLSQTPVLLVAAEGPLLTGMRAALEAAGVAAFSVCTASEAHAALLLHPTVVVVDLDLPDGGAEDLIAALRASSPRLQLLAVAANPSMELVRRAIQHRILGLLPSPPSDALLVQEVQRALTEAQVAGLRQQLLLTKGGVAMPVDDAGLMSQYLDEALAGLFMLYQPLVRALDGSVYAYEALMRSRSVHLPGPLQMLAAAEALGRMPELGRAVRACVAETLYDSPDCDASVFVNLHPLELTIEGLLGPDDPLLPFATRVVYEVTERAQLDASPGLSPTLAALRAAGFRIALDDLGEGYAGLSWLVRLMPDVAKLDMSLVRDIHGSRIKRELVASLVNVCRRAGAVVVAEGVECEAEAQQLLDLGCHLLQGYYFARPGAPFPTPRLWRSV